MPPARSTAASTPWSAPKPLDDFVEPRGRPAAGLAGGASRARQRGRPSTEVRNAPDLTPVFSAAVAGRRRRPAGDRQRPQLHADRAQPARGRSSSRWPSPIAPVGPAVAVPRPDDRPPAAPAGACRPPRPARPRARGARCRACPPAATRSGCSPAPSRDMSQSLRQRIDNIEAFAADVTHELKNPLASLRSAVDGLDRVEDPELRQQLLDVARDDVVRLDRLISDISEAARTDAELARARFEPVDLGPLIEQLVASWETSPRERRCAASPSPGRARTARSSWASPTGWRARSTISSTMRSASRPPGGLVEIAAHAGRRRGPHPHRRRRARRPARSA